jgi:hypothetical protein
MDPQQAHAYPCPGKENRVYDHRTLVGWVFSYEVIGEGQQDDEHEEQEVQADESSVVPFDGMDCPMVGNPVASYDKETEDETDEFRQQPVDLVVQLGCDEVLGELHDTDVDRKQGYRERENSIAKQRESFDAEPMRGLVFRFGCCLIRGHGRYRNNMNLLLLFLFVYYEKRKEKKEYPSIHRRNIKRFERWMPVNPES